jgi:hypothetical protein
VFGPATPAFVEDVVSHANYERPTGVPLSIQEATLFGICWTVVALVFGRLLSGTAIIGRRQYGRMPIVANGFSPRRQSRHIQDAQHTPMR